MRSYNILNFLTTGRRLHDSHIHRQVSPVHGQAEGVAVLDDLLGRLLGRVLGHRLRLLRPAHLLPLPRL